MNAGESNLFLAGALLIPLILLTILAGLYLLSRFLENKSQKDLKRTRGELRQMGARRRQIERDMGAFSVGDPEPFGSRVGEIHTRLERIAKQAADLEYRHVALQEQIHELSSNRWRTMMGAPYFWYPLRKEVDRLSDAIQRAKASLDAAGELEETLSSASWDVAQQARSTYQLQVQVSDLMENLRSRNMGGETIESAFRQEAETRKAFEQLPPYFLAAGQGTVLELADTASTATAHALLQEARPILEGLLAQAQDWEARYKHTEDKVAIMSQVLDEARQTLDGMPEKLEIELYKTQIDGLQVISENLEATASRLEAENMPLVAGEAERVTQTAQETIADLKRARRELGAVDRLRQELSEGFKRLSLTQASLASKTVFPIVWRESVEKLTGLNREVHALGPGEGSRTPEQVRDDFVHLSEFQEDFKNLARHCEEVEQAHSELMNLLASAEFRQLDEWLANARKLAEDVMQYAPENWPKSDNIPALPVEIRSFADEAQRLAPADRSASISETEIARRLEETKDLAEAYQRLRQRVENVKTRLEENQKDENHAREQSESAQATLNQIAFIVHSNKFLSETVQGELDRLTKDVENMLAEISQRERGAVEKKARRVNTLMAKVESSANRWLDLLNKASLAAVEGLSTSLTTLDQIAALDESAIVEARRLVSAGPQFGANDPGRKSRLRLEEFIGEFKRTSDYWQACAAAAHALRDVEEPVVKSYEGAKQNRDSTHALLDEVANWLRQNRTWPPTSVTLEDERVELNRIDAAWESLKEKRARAISLVQDLSSLSARYQTLAEKIRQGADRADQEMAQVEEMEAGIHELAQVWQDQWYAYRDEPEVSREIRRLLDDTDNQIAQLKRQYKKGAISYEQITGSLKTLERTIRYYQVAIDEDHALDAAGNVKRRR